MPDTQLLTKLNGPLEMLYHWERETPTRLYLRQPKQGRYRDTTWKEAAHKVRRTAAGLKALALPPACHIAILSKNCDGWLTTDLAIWMAGHVSVPLYPTLGADSISAILQHSGARVLFVGKLDDWSAVKGAVPSGVKLVSLEGMSHEGCLPWEDFVGKLAPLEENPRRDLSELATIIYTSGTTGAPKGVMHCFRSFAVAAHHILNTVPVAPSRERFFSYLPLAHVAERLLTETLALYLGATVYFAETLDSFPDDLRRAAPTVFLAVPRIWVKFQSGILAKLPDEKLRRLLKLPLLSFFVRRKIRRALGLHRAKITLSGAAATPPALIEWFGRLGVEILEAYGMTENLAYSHFNPPGRPKIGSVGQPWPAVETRIGDNGEVQIKGPCNLLGYYRAPELTAEVLRDGYLHTGDQGEIDGQGYLSLTGRVKDLFKTSKGKYVAPAPIELKLSRCVTLEQICVMGAGLPQPLAVAVLSEQGAKFSPTDLKTALEAELADINERLDPHERLSKIVVVGETWSVENGLLTPTLKTKRNALEKRYQSDIERWSAASGQVIWHHPRP